MTHAFHLVAVILLVTLQTALRLHVPGLDNFFDLLVVYVAYLGLFRRFKEGAPIVIVTGLCMDSLSGGSFGLFLTSYIWFYALMRWIVRFLDPANRMLIFFSPAMGVVIENVVHLGTAFMLNDGFPVLQVIRDRTAAQLVWALATGPVFLLLARRIHRQWDKWLGAVMVRESSSSR
ncbi:MAG: hypothetical protein ACOWWM_03990 [Desulfobacterales bacterium]